jgi:hypothetical protein
LFLSAASNMTLSSVKSCNTNNSTTDYTSKCMLFTHEEWEAAVVTVHLKSIMMCLSLFMIWTEFL